MAQNKPKTTIVRAADGKLYAVSKTGPPRELTATETKAVEDIVPKTEKTLEGIVSETMQAAGGCTQRVHIIIPEVDI